ncbi:MAG TPA: hypothetical protein VKV16_07815 [Solirubrobacteraceae bacterium]|nr:hypothetical protein [Solirubrobacteraceae bacterium]
MSLTTRKALRLEDAGLVKLFDDNRTIWAANAREAYSFIAEAVKAAGQPVRRDDLVAPLRSTLEITQTLRTFLSDNHLAQQFWYEWFAELIIDREWSNLQTPTKGAANDASGS